MIKLADDSAIENEFLYNNDWELVGFGERDGDDLLRRKNSVKIIRGTRLIHNRVDESRPPGWKTPSRRSQHERPV